MASELWRYDITQHPSYMAACNITYVCLLNCMQCTYTYIHKCIIEIINSKAHMMYKLVLPAKVGIKYSYNTAARDLPAGIYIRQIMSRNKYHLTPY